MTENLMPIRYESGEPTIMGRELHELLNVPEAYEDWFYGMRGFEEGKDYWTEFEEDHRLSLGMAKAICLSRDEKECAAYLTDIEGKWKETPLLMRGELSAAYRKIDSLSFDCAVQKLRLAELQPHRTYYDEVLENELPVSTEDIAKDYGMPVECLNKMLCEKGILRRMAGMYVPAADYDGQGYTIHHAEYAYFGNGNGYKPRREISWLQKGRLLIYDSLKADGILPEVEK